MPVSYTELKRYIQTTTLSQQSITELLAQHNTDEKNLTLNAFRYTRDEILPQLLATVTNNDEKILLERLLDELEAIPTKISLSAVSQLAKLTTTQDNILSTLQTWLTREENSSPDGKLIEHSLKAIHFLLFCIEVELEIENPAPKKLLGITLLQLKHKRQKYKIITRLKQACHNKKMSPKLIQETYSPLTTKFNPTQFINRLEHTSHLLVLAQTDIAKKLIALKNKQEALSALLDLMHQLYVTQDAKTKQSIFWGYAADQSAFEILLKWLEIPKKQHHIWFTARSEFLGHSWASWIKGMLRQGLSYTQLINENLISPAHFQQTISQATQRALLSIQTELLPSQSQKDCSLSTRTLLTLLDKSIKELAVEQQKIKELKHTLHSYKHGCSLYSLNDFVNNRSYVAYWLSKPYKNCIQDVKQVLRENPALITTKKQNLASTTLAEIKPRHTNSQLLTPYIKQSVTKNLA